MIGEILAYVVRVKCTHCEGKKRVRLRANDPNGELVDCPHCDGLGHTEATVPLDAVVKLIRGLAQHEVAEERRRRSGR